MNRKRVILTSCSIILLCTAIIVGVTFALFSEQIALTNHLKAGELAITLTRTNLKYSTLDSEGYLKEITVEDDEDFTASNSRDKNIFNVGDGTLIAPGSYFESTMKLTNNGNVAFTYEVSLAFNDEKSGKNIADQILITVTDTEGNLLIDKAMLLSDFPTEKARFTLLQGEMAASEVTDEFVITVKFLNDADDDDKVYLKDGVINNSAKSETAIFDLYVTATQKTTAPEQSVESTVETTEESTQGSEG